MITRLLFGSFQILHRDKYNPAGTVIVSDLVHQGVTSGMHPFFYKMVHEYL